MKLIPFFRLSSLSLSDSFCAEPSQRERREIRPLSSLCTYNPSPVNQHPMLSIFLPCYSEDVSSLALSRAHARTHTLLIFFWSNPRLSFPFSPFNFDCADHDLCGAERYGEREREKERGHISRSSRQKWVSSFFPFLPCARLSLRRKLVTMEKKS